MSKVCFLNQMENAYKHFPELVDLVENSRKENFNASEYDMSQFYKKNFVVQLLEFTKSSPQILPKLISAHNASRFEWALFTDKNFSISLQYCQKGILPEIPVKTCIANNLKYIVVKGKVVFEVFENNISEIDINESCLKRLTPISLSSGGQVAQRAIVDCIVPREFEDDTYMLIIAGNKKSDTCWNFDSNSLKFDSLTSTDVDYSRLEYCLAIFEKFGCVESLDVVRDVCINHPAYYVRWEAINTAINLSEDNEWNMKLLQEVMEADSNNEVRECARGSLKIMFPELEVA
jgi:hypothetical protein